MIRDNHFCGLPTEMWIVEILATNFDGDIKSIQALRRTCKVFSRWLPVERLYIAAVQVDGLALWRVPDAFLTPAICAAAAHQNGRSIKYVPPQVVDLCVCLAAIHQDGLQLRRIPETFRTHEIYMEAVRQNGCALQWVPLECRDQGICETAVHQNRLSMKWVPVNLHSITPLRPKRVDRVVWMSCRDIVSHYKMSPTRIVYSKLTRKPHLKITSDHPVIPDTPISKRNHRCSSRAIHTMV